MTELSSPSPNSASAPSHLSSFALIYHIPPDNTKITWPERVLQLARFRYRKSKITALSAIKLRLVISEEQEAHWLLIGAALGPNQQRNNGLNTCQSTSSLSSSMVSNQQIVQNSRPVSTVLPSLAPSFSTKRNLFRICVTVVRECEDLGIVVAECLELLRAFASLYGASAVLSVHIDLCHAAEHQTMVVVSGDAAIVSSSSNNQNVQQKAQ